MKQILFWHVVSHSEDDKQVPTSLLSTHQIQSTLTPFPHCPKCTALLKETLQIKKKAEQQSTIQLGDWENRNWKCGGLHDQNAAICWPNSTQLSYYGNPGHGANRRALGQKHDSKTKLQNYSCSKWQTTDLKAQWHVNCIASWTFQTMLCQFRFGPMSC